MFGWIRRAYAKHIGYPLPRDETKWHPWRLAFPRWGNKGKLVYPHVWRRWRNGKWEYAERDPTIEEVRDMF